MDGSCYTVTVLLTFHCELMMMSLLVIDVSWRYGWRSIDYTEGCDNDVWRGAFFLDQLSLLLDFKLACTTNKALMTFLYRRLKLVVVTFTLNMIGMPLCTRISTWMLLLVTLYMFTNNLICSLSQNKVKHTLVYNTHSTNIYTQLNSWQQYFIWWEFVWTICRQVLELRVKYSTVISINILIQDTLLCPYNDWEGHLEQSSSIKISMMVVYWSM